MTALSCLALKRFWGGGAIDETVCNTTTEDSGRRGGRDWIYGREKQHDGTKVEMIPPFFTFVIPYLLGSFVFSKRLALVVGYSSPDRSHQVSGTRVGCPYERQVLDNI